jgi:hypothetical protein
LVLKSGGEFIARQRKLKEISLEESGLSLLGKKGLARFVQIAKQW